MAAGAATGAVWLGNRVRGESDRAHPVLGRGHLYSDHAAGAAGVRGDAHRNGGHPVRQEGASVGCGHRIVLVIIIYILQIFDMCILLLYEREREREKRDLNITSDLICFATHTRFSFCKPIKQNILLLFRVYKKTSSVQIYDMSMFSCMCGVYRFCLSLLYLGLV